MITTLSANDRNWNLIFMHNCEYHNTYIRFGSKLLRPTLHSIMGVHLHDQHQGYGQDLLLLKY
uniref:Putative ovule protein n=1 Tax=Solanum chacoense TaxID=4108 RepID=A0A0V0H9T8_SOLCH